MLQETGQELGKTSLPAWALGWFLTTGPLTPQRHLRILDDNGHKGAVGWVGNLVPPFFLNPDDAEIAGQADDQDDNAGDADAEREALLQGLLIVVKPLDTRAPLTPGAVVSLSPGLHACAVSSSGLQGVGWESEGGPQVGHVIDSEIRGVVLIGDVDQVGEFRVQVALRRVWVAPRQQPGVGDVGVNHEVSGGQGFHVLAGLEGAVPQQLFPGPQVQLVGVHNDNALHQHMADAH